MPAPPSKQSVLDPIESINKSIAHAWEALCRTYSVTASQPNLAELFQGTTLEDPDQAAEVVLVNMLLEIIESIDRFSPWYRMPARTFGLISMRDPYSGQQRWVLAPEGCQRYYQLLNPIMDVIDLHRGVLRGILLVEGHMEIYLNRDRQVILSCDCDPPHAIQVSRSVQSKTVIICDDCRKPYK